MIKFLQKPGPIKKIVLGGLLVVICVMMVITLVPGGLFGDYLGGSLTAQGVIAKVGDQEITVTDVKQQATATARQRLKSSSIPPSLMPYFMQQAAQQLIVRKAAVYEADRMGLGVSDDEVRDVLHHGEWGQVLFPNGNFIGQVAYEQVVAQNTNLSVAQFEREIKADIAQRKLLAAINAPITVTDKEISEEVKKQGTKVKFDYAVLTLDDVKKQIKPTDAELKAFYDKNKQIYANSIPEKIKARYIFVDTEKVAEQLTVTPAELQQYYNQHQDEYRIPESVTVRHILIKTPTPGADGKVDQKAVDAARTKAEDIDKQLKAGANFGDLAKKNSEDPGSAKDGGLLPPITRGRTVPEFEQAAFTTPPGQTTGVIRTSYGFHIIHVESKQEPRQKPIEEVKVEIEPILKKQKAAAQTQSIAGAVQTLARTTGMDKAAADKHLSVTTTEFITQTDQLPGVGNAPDLMAALFSAKKNDPAALAAAPTGYVIYQVTEIQAPQTPTFEQVKAKVEDQFRNERAQALLAQKVQEMSDRAHADHDLNKAAKEVGATLKTSDLVDRNSQVPDVGPLTGQAAVVFTLKPGEISAPIPAGGNGVVLKVLEVQEPSPEQLKQDRAKAKESLLEQRRQEYEGLYVENLRNKLEKDGKIKINKQEMDRLMTPSEGS